MKILSIVVILVACLLINRALGATIRKLGAHKHVAPSRIRYLTKTGNISMFAVFVFLVCLVLGMGEVSVLLSSAFAVVGVAFFAQWSILSNITASVVIFFAFPYRVGDRIKITDSDFDLSGTVEEISLFHVLVRTADGNLITYPNSLILQKPVFKLDRGNRTFPQKVTATPPPAPRDLRRKRGATRLAER